MAYASEITLKLTIDGKEAIATLNLTDTNIKQIITSFNNASREAKNYSYNIVHSLEMARNSIQGFREAYNVFATVFAKPIQLTVEAENAKATFATFLGSAEKAEHLLNQLRQLSTKTPLEFTGIRDTALQLMQFGISAQEVIPTIRMLGDVAGGNQQRMQQLALVFGQVAANGRLTGQDLMQMVNAGFNPLQVMAEKTGKSISELKSEMEQGKISFADVKQVFVDVTSEGGKFYQLMEKQSETLGGQLSNLSDSITSLQTAAGETISIGLSPLLSHFSQLANTINQLPAPLKGAIGTVGYLTTALVLLRVTGIGSAIKELMFMRPALLTMAASTGVATGAVGGLTISFRAAATAAKSFFASLGPIGWAILGITAIIEIYNAVASSMEDANQKAGESTDQLNEKFKDFSNDKILNHLKETKKLIEQNDQKIKELEASYNKINSQSSSSSAESRQQLRELVQINQEINDRKNTQAKLQKYLNELQDEYNKRNQDALKLLNQQIDELEKKINLDSKSPKERKLEELKLEYEKEKALLKQGYEAGIKSESEYNALLKQLTDNYNKQRNETLNKYANDRKDKLLNSKIKELEIEANFTIKQMELNNENKNNIIQKEIEYLEKKKDLLLKYGQNTLQIQKDIELKKLEIIRNSRENEFQYKTKEIEKENEINKLQLSLSNASKKEILEQEIKYLNQKYNLYKEYQQNTYDLEIQLQLKKIEYDNYLKNEYKASDETKENYRKELQEFYNTNKQKYQALKQWKEQELQLYKNDEEAKLLISQVYEKRITELKQQEEQVRREATISSLNYIAGAYGKHTAIGKAASIAMATINTYEAATKALTAGPIVGPILAALITAAGLANVAKIVSTETPKVTAYAKGGIALVGEKGPEIIAPAMDYAQGQAALINAVVRSIKPTSDNDFEKLINKIDNWKDRLEFKISRGDLYAAWDKEQKFRERNKI